MTHRLTPFLIVFLLVAGGFLPAMAQSDLEDVFLRKAVKEFVAKQYDEAITDLEQVLTANKGNAKAKKLISKCYERKGSAFLAQNQIAEADLFIRKALEQDPLNADAQKDADMIKSLTQAAQAREAAPEAPRYNSAPAQASYPQQAAPAAAAVPQQIVITPQMMGGVTDTHQAKVISSLLQNFNKQQEMMSQQMNASNKMMLRTDDDKEKYLQALITSADQKNDLMKNFLFIGGAVVLGIIVVIGLLFVFVFHKYAKTADLRTLQATDAITALLTGPGSGQPGGNPLMIGYSRSPGAPGAEGAVNTVSMDALRNNDPVQRAHAVEAVAAEIIEPEKGTRAEKIKRLEELLKDDNNRVRANAAKALYEIDKDISLRTLKEMLENDSKRMRASAVWALGEIGSEEALTLILGMPHEDDEIVKYNMKVALEKVKSLNRFPMSKEQQEHINGLLVQYVDLT